MCVEHYRYINISGVECVCYDDIISARARADTTTQLFFYQTSYPNVIAMRVIKTAKKASSLLKPKKSFRDKFSKEKKIEKEHLFA